jgi:predicted ATPase
MARRARESRLPAPYLRRIWLDDAALEAQSGYPFDQRWLRRGFELEFTTPITIIVGENGAGKSTLIEAIAALAGYDEAGGGKGYSPVDHSTALDASGSDLARVLKASWLPKITTGWFFRAESFFSVARYLDDMARQYGGLAPDFLSWSHGEGFIRVFEERCARQGVYFMDEPESALSPRRQLALLRILAGIHEAGKAQVIMATHSPILMALPQARLLEITRFGLAETRFDVTDHFQLYRQFLADPESFIRDALDDLV